VRSLSTSTGRCLFRAEEEEGQTVSFRSNQLETLETEPSGSAPAASIVTSILTAHHSSAVRGGVLGTSRGEAVEGKWREVQPSDRSMLSPPKFHRLTSLESFSNSILRDGKTELIGLVSVLAMYR